MTTITKDPLLAVAKGIIYFLMGVIAFAGVIVAIGAPAFAIFGGEIAPDITSADVPSHIRWLIVLLLAAVAGILYLGWRFFLNMLKIVESVGEGDPFVPANGDRLTAMAWLMLAINLAAIPVAGIALYIANVVGENPGTVDASVDFGGLVLILTLFILARVFRHGTAMRDDLEGTV
ncbi:DUF2975 domain-containing protein [Altererythrobacter sp. ZODW24]|uniref:DUF2975 domain-containing protein n=1 Tax=Altererythrobacter sp. ZODW24 TaxID=2185142 RepID=UPI000DF7A21D|nr:DUF2975 domain-containing protein [Altererythrobacter sp. ZODW24]